ncbi:4Fe-4S dicluster domain-containing protein [Candidatus Auribacterota bacterium]
MFFRKIRIYISFLVLTLIVLSFLGGEEISSFLSSKILFFQFTPAFLKSLQLNILACLILVLLLLLTFFFGRIYCSCLCPLGILQDLVIYLSKKVKKKAYHYQKPDFIFHYTIFLLTASSFILGTLVLVNFLDPYSFFGRIIVHLFKPPLAFTNNILVAFLEYFDFFLFSQVKTIFANPVVLAFSVSIFSILTFLSFFYGRLYCNKICPVGAILRLISHFSLFKIKIKQEKCINCQLCEKSCRAQCIDSSKVKIDSSRCVLCFDCFKACPQILISYSYRLTKTKLLESDPERRIFLKKLSYLSAGLIGLSFPSRLFSKPIIKQKRAIPVTPPGSGGVDSFSEKCTACHLCVTACPTQVLRPSWLEYGLQGIMQPVLDYQKNYCEYECNTCSHVCPTGAIKPLSLPDKQLTQLGKVQLFKERCIVYINKRDCGACAEVCPTHAVYTEEKDNVFYPKTRTEPCNGCGACQYVCPADPKAIMVKGNVIHKRSQKPFFEKSEVNKKQQIKEVEDFPF